MPNHKLHSPNIVACVWDFDKTLLRGYMQAPLFHHYGVDEKTFWDEVNGLPARYASRGYHVSKDTVYLNHMLTYVRAGRMKGLNNALLREMGKELELYPGLPGFFTELREEARSQPMYRKHEIALEHYIISTGLAEMIRGCEIAGEVENIYGCEFIENPLPPGYLRQPELDLEIDAREIGQIGTIVDNTIKTRFVFEINKGTNKIPDIDVNSNIAQEDRRVPIRNMIYTADGPSDIPVFSVVKKNGGRTFAVYDPESDEEFEQNDNLQQVGRIDSYGPADYRASSNTHKWIKMHVRKICDRIVREQEEALKTRVSVPPRHLHKAELPPEVKGPEQAALWESED